jgi:hypothetical protein
MRSSGLVGVGRFKPNDTVGSTTPAKEPSTEGTPPKKEIPDIVSAFDKGVGCASTDPMFNSIALSNSSEMLGGRGAEPRRF